eukprot:CAMPEP_0116931756 /NCGR_PEP_ID=MMETSP0467-20121206/28006_1 /TAXON_ID=283647 /ORGANISM="Mesodinium pulex, Strain SPMC105" /LENGTH=94 /DNA_ID=CAMNT_0004612257 /DNA_START=386 /DNA_END=670 /DNA_ORIENTATION=-
MKRNINKENNQYNSSPNLFRQNIEPQKSFEKVHYSNKVVDKNVELKTLQDTNEHNKRAEERKSNERQTLEWNVKNMQNSEYKQTNHIAKDNDVV